ncbi:hypothetical protein [Mycobacterium marinum]|uniref:hypothetical protein n=2 Tax=Mycobacterium marinum TaxID=1781 RepID=UPI002358D67A|nr:hypothetical protein [Mycobacterium marinum]MDC8980548.1 hypothetical protein [Mycobacterium marinum]
MASIEGAAQAAPDPHEMVRIADAASELGISESLLISMLADSGLLLVIPGTEDERCGNVTKVPDLGVPLPVHVDDCECRFIASPHPDLVELGL